MPISLVQMATRYFTFAQERPSGSRAIRPPPATNGRDSGAMPTGVRVSPKSQVVRAGQARPAAASTEPRRQRSVAGKLQFAKPAATKPREPAAMAPF